MPEEPTQHQQSPRPPVLDYGRPRTTPDLWARSISRAVLASIFLHLLVICLYAATLDGGVTLMRCLAVSAAYSVLAVLIIWRRRFRPTWVDLAFIAVGYPAMVAVTEWWLGEL